MAAALFHRTSFVDDQSTPHELFAVTSFDSMIQVGIVDLGKTETARFIGEPVAHHADGSGIDTLLLKPSGEIRLCGPIWKISNV